MKEEENNIAESWKEKIGEAAMQNLGYEPSFAYEDLGEIGKDQYDAFGAGATWMLEQLTPLLNQLKEEGK